MKSLIEALPELTGAIEAALTPTGRADVAEQLREVEIERWSYHSGDNVGYIYLRSPRPVSELDERLIGIGHAETITLMDTASVNLDLDNHHRLTGIELLRANEVISRMEKRIAV